jgi:hypothetical protein
VLLHKGLLTFGTLISCFAFLLQSLCFLSGAEGIRTSDLRRAKSEHYYHACSLLFKITCKIALLPLATFASVRGCSHGLVYMGFNAISRLVHLWRSTALSRFRLVPFLIVTPLIFLGGSFYSVDMLPPFWQTATLFNPVVYLISGFRWSFYGIADVSVGVSLAMTICFLAICLVTVWWIFKTGYRLKT